MATDKELGREAFLERMSNEEPVFGELVEDDEPTILDERVRQIFLEVYTGSKYPNIADPRKVVKILNSEPREDGSIRGTATDTEIGLFFDYLIRDGKLSYQAV